MNIKVRERMSSAVKINRPYVGLPWHISIYVSRLQDQEGRLHNWIRQRCPSFDPCYSSGSCIIGALGHGSRDVERIIHVSSTRTTVSEQHRRTRRPVLCIKFKHYHIANSGFILLKNLPKTVKETTKVLDEIYSKWN